MDDMKRIFLYLFALPLCLLLLLNALSAQQTAGELLQKALWMEEAQGDIAKAIEIYTEILKRFPDERKVAAKAQLHIGLCYAKLGLREAQDAFEKVVDEYPDQRDEVKIARQQLMRLARAKAVIEKGHTELSMRKVFTGHPREFVGAPSPDGRYLSTVDWTTGDLAVRTISTGKQRRLTQKGTWETSEYALVSIWSPDGKTLAYSWLNEEGFYELRIIGLDGTGSRALYRNREYFLVQPYDWSPDGQFILAGIGEQQSVTQIAAISYVDGSIRILNEGRGIHPSFYLPDGSAIVCQSVSASPGSRGSDIVLLSVENGKEIPLVEHPAHDFSLGWDPQENRLLFMSDRTGTMSIWALEVTDGAPQGQPYLIKKNIGKMSPLGFTRAGGLYYVIYTSMEDVYTAALDLEKNSLLVTPRQAEDLFMGANSSPDFSPDGNSLAYISRRAHVPGRFESLAICILSLDSGEKRELFPALELMRFIRWSADGKKFFSYGIEKKGRKGLYSIDTQTGAVDIMWTCRLDEEVIKQLDVFPEGKTLAYKMWERKKVGEGNVMSIRVRDIRTGEEKELYQKVNASESHHMSLSSDGRWIVFDDRTPMWTLNIIPAGGGEPREILKMETGESPTSFDWKPGVREIFFTKSISGQLNQLWLMKLDGEEPQRIDMSMRGMKELRFHPDGKRIAFSAAYREAELWVMENLLRLERSEKAIK